MRRQPLLRWFGPPKGYRRSAAAQICHSRDTKVSRFPRVYRSLRGQRAPLSNHEYYHRQFCQYALSGSFFPSMLTLRKDWLSPIFHKSFTSLRQKVYAASKTASNTTFLLRRKNKAERQGFEPWDPFDRITSLAMMRIRPLCHLSSKNRPLKAGSDLCDTS